MKPPIRFAALFLAFAAPFTLHADGIAEQDARFARLPAGVSVLPEKGLVAFQFMGKDGTAHLVRKTWWTDTTAQTGAQGGISLRGFLGDYEIRVRAAGVEKTVPAQLGRGGANISIELAP